MKSYLKFLSRNKLYTAVEAAGLIISLAFVILIGCYAWEQYAVTHEAPGYKRIYVLGMPQYFGLTYGFKEAVGEKVPEIEIFSHVALDMSSAVTWDDRHEMAALMAVDRDFFDIFPNFRPDEVPPEIFPTDYSVLVSESFANTHGLVPGDMLQIAGADGHPCTVCGILKDFRRSIFPYVDIVVPVTSILNSNKEGDPYDFFGSHVPFVRLREGDDFDAFMDKIEEICKEIYPHIYGTSFFTYVTATRVDDIFFTPDGIGSPQFNKGDLNTLRMLMLVGLLLLISAVFNYINLNTALTGKRAKEMATRRLLGASRAEIIGKYIGESLLFTSLCFGAAVLLAVAFAPVMDRLLNNPYITVRVLFSPVTIGGFVATVSLVGFLSGIIPAMLASKYKPVDVIKGSFRVASRMTFSKIFIVLQNTLAVVLIAMTMVMEAQYAKSLARPKHVATENLFYLVLPTNIAKTSLISALKELPCVGRIGRTIGAPGFKTGGQFSRTRYDEEIMYRTFKMDSTAFTMLNFEKTRDFSAPTDGSVWFGERAFAATGLDEDFHDIPVLGQRMGNVGQTAGTIADFPFNPSNMGEEDYLLVQVLGDAVFEELMSYGLLIETRGDKEEAREMIMAAYRKWIEDTLPVYMEWEADFLDGNYRKALEPARNNMRLMEIFMLLAIMISMLGLVAMSTYFAGQNAHSIAVRKVFGSTVEKETFRSVARYLLYVGIACAVGVPVAVWAAGRYLQSFIYRLDHYGWIFIVTVLLSVLFAMLSVFWQILYAARTNPVVELKKE